MPSFFEKRYLLSFILFMQSFQSTTRVIRFDVFADIKRNENSKEKNVERKWNENSNEIDKNNWLQDFWKITVVFTCRFDENKI